MRGCREHRDMSWGDVKLLTSNNGTEYLQYTERQTKTRTGSDPRNIRSTPPTMWSTPESERDPVTTYKLYKEKRPTNMMNSEDPFYLGVNHTRSTSVKTTEKAWFKSQALGVNTLGSIMKEMFKRAGLQEGGGKVANHSGRKAMIQTLKDAKVPDTDIIQVSGHRNLQSLNSYDVLSEAGGDLQHPATCITHAIWQVSADACTSHLWC